MKIIFIRHAEGYHNIGKIRKQFIFFGKPKSKNWKIKFPKLTKKGIEQCLEVKEKILNLNLSIDKIYVSPLTRTLETATTIFEKANNIISIEEIRENVVNPCDYREPVLVQKSKFKHIDFSNINDIGNINKTESKSQIDNRCHEFFERLKNDKKNNNCKIIVVVTHGAFLKNFLDIYGSTLDIDDMTFFSNCEIRFGFLNQ